MRDVKSRVIQTMSEMILKETISQLMNYTKEKILKKEKDRESKANEIKEMALKYISEHLIKEKFSKTSSEIIKPEVIYDRNVRNLKEFCMRKLLDEVYS